MEPRERDMALAKIDEWRAKADGDLDPFNKYVSLFIAYNVFYALYEKTRNADDFRDSEGAISTLDLISDRTELFQEMESDIREYAQIIPVYEFREEYWPTNKATNKIPISQSLKQALNEKNANQAIEMLIKWLYKVRCNLVHGEKNYNDASQRKLLSKSSSLLDKYLLHVLKCYRTTFGGVSQPIQPDEVWHVTDTS
jgi:hypothetical protein